MLDETKNNFICALDVREQVVGCCFADISTGELYGVQLEGEGLAGQAANELGRFSPKEILVNPDALDMKEMTGNAILSHTIGGLCAGIAAHLLWMLVG